MNTIYIGKKIKGKKLDAILDSLSETPVSLKPMNKLKTNGGTDAPNTNNMKKINPLFLMVLIVGTDTVKEGNIATIAPDDSKVNKLSLQKVLIDETDSTQQNDGDPVVRPLTDDENSYYQAQLDIAAKAQQDVLDAAVTNIANGTIPNA